MGKGTPGARRGSRDAAAEDDPRPNILQLNTEGITANKTSVIEQLAYKNKVFIIVLQETHCTTADKLVIPNFSLAGSVLSRNHGLPTFVHERLEWSLVDQSPEQSETEWLCVDIAGYNRRRRRIPSQDDGESLDSWATSNNLDCCITQRKQSVFPLTHGTSAPTQT